MDGLARQHNTNSYKSLSLFEISLRTSSHSLISQFKVSRSTGLFCSLFISNFFFCFHHQVQICFSRISLLLVLHWKKKIRNLIYWGFWKWVCARVMMKFSNFLVSCCEKTLQLKVDSGFL